MKNIHTDTNLIKSGDVQVLYDQFNCSFINVITSNFYKLY